MTKDELIQHINISGIQIDDDNDLNITITNEISSDDLKTVLENIFNYELDLENVNVKLNLKGLNNDLLIEAFKYSLSRDDLKDPVMLLNILNLIKIYNTLDDSFFENKDIYINSIEDMIDIKISLTPEINAFIKQLSIYFLSLFKSYNKINYTPLDNYIELPKTYEILISSCDFMTLSGIFAVSEPFNTSECVYILNAFKYLETLLLKNNITMDLMDIFLKKD